MHDVDSGATTETVHGSQELDHGRHSDDLAHTRRDHYLHWLVSKQCLACGSDHIRYKWSVSTNKTLKGWVMMCFTCKKKWSDPKLDHLAGRWDK